jgi:hypothetical protein
MMDRPLIVRAILITPLIAACASAADDAPRSGRVAMRPGPLQGPWVFRTGGMPLPFKDREGNPPDLLAIYEVCWGQAVRDTSQAREEAGSLIKVLSEQAGRTHGEARRRTEADIERLRGFLKKLDDPAALAAEARRRPRLPTGAPNDLRDEGVR